MEIKLTSRAEQADLYTVLRLTTAGAAGSRFRLYEIRWGQRGEGQRAWKACTETHENSSTLRRYMLTHRLDNILMFGIQDPSAFLALFCHTVCELKCRREVILEQQVLTIALRALRKGYEMIKFNAFHDPIYVLSKDKL